MEFESFSTKNSLPKRSELEPGNDLAEPPTKAQDSGEENPESNSAREIGGRKEGLDPTRYGDWEKNGRCIDF